MQWKRFTTHPQQSGHLHQFLCSHTLNFPRSARVRWRDLHIITSWSSSLSSLHANFVAIRENQFEFPAKSNQVFSAGTRTLYPLRYHSLSCEELQTWHIGTSLVRTDLAHIFSSSCYTRHISLCFTTSRHLVVPIPEVGRADTFDRIVTRPQRFTNIH